MHNMQWNFHVRDEDVERLKFMMVVEINGTDGCEGLFYVFHVWFALLGLL